jgi:hypothetical protein
MSAPADTDFADVARWICQTGPAEHRFGRARCALPLCSCAGLRLGQAAAAVARVGRGPGPFAHPADAMAETENA